MRIPLLGLALFVATLRQASADEERKIVRINYDEILILVEDHTNELLVFKGVADPLLFSSKAHLIVIKLSGMDDLDRAIAAQEAAGPFAPQAGPQVERIEFNVETTSTSGKVKFIVFGEEFLWMPGGPKAGWIGLSDSFASRIAHVESLNRHPPINESDFIEIDAYIEEVDREIDEERAAGTESDPLSYRGQHEASLGPEKAPG